MITKVTNLTEKSFKNYTGPNYEFKMRNVIFGYNGKGKSSLAKGIRNEFLKDDNNTLNNVRFFSKDYISKNLMLKDGDKVHIKGVQANFGEKEIDIEEKIKEYEMQKKDTASIDEKFGKLIDISNKRIDDIYKQKKGKLLIQKKKEDILSEKWIENYKRDLTAALKLCENEDELNHIGNDEILSKKKIAIDSLSINNISLINPELILNCVKILKSTYGSELIPKTSIIEWIKQGLEIHQDENENTKCLFCDSGMTLEAIEKKVDTYTNNEKQKAILKLEELNKYLLGIYDDIEILLKNQVNIINVLDDNKLIENFERIKAQKYILDNYIQSIESKILNMSSVINMNIKQLIDALPTIKSECDKIIKRKEVLKNIIDTQVLKINDMIKGAIAKEILNDSLIKENRIELLKLKEEKIAIIAENKKIDENIRALKNQKNNTNDFAIHINKIFDDIGIEFKLELIEKDYVIKHPNDNIVLSLEDISEGEKNLMALMFFYYELFNDKEQKNIKDEIKIIIIDDPISSMDESNKMYVLEIIKEILKSNVQIFVFTHVWDDYCNISYGMKEEPTSLSRCFEIKKIDGESSVVMVKNKENPYKHAFKEIYDFSQNTNAENLSDCEIYHYPNVMRRVLEEFMSFKVKDSLPTASNINNVYIALGLERATEKEKSKVGMLLNVCNILSHKNSKNPEEILKSAKNLMRWIKDIDVTHFNTMKQ